MQSRQGLNLRAEAIEVTWCACERCLGMGPHSMTLTRNGQEKTIDLRRFCCLTSNCKATELRD